MMTTPARIKVDVSKDEDGNLLMIVEQELTREQKDTLYQAMRLFKGGDFSGPGFNVYLKGEDIVLEHKAKINPAWDASGGAVYDPRIDPLLVSTSNIEDTNNPFMIVNGTLIINEVKCDRCQAKAPA